VNHRELEHSLEAANRLESVAMEPGLVEANLLTWTAVHGNLCLALRNPSNRGASRQIVIDFVRELGAYLLERGALDKATLERAERLEGF
jgi:hypothetical protein